MGVIEAGDKKDHEDVSTLSPPTTMFRYNSPLVQVSLIGLVCFCCPGMFNALSGMGGGGQVDPTAANNANTALYTTFAIFGILGGGIYNILGPHLTLFAGCSTYVLYGGSFLYYNHYHHQAFAIVAGAILGIGAGLLWSSQGAIMTSYPPVARKGTYISLFWSIFNLGGVIGGLIPFILNYNRKTAVSVNDGTYIAFMCFMSAGTILTLSILPPSRVIRDDGSRATNVKYSNTYTEAIEILKLFINWKMILIIPAAWASNFFYSYQFNNVNGLMFNVRTRGLNNVFYWGAQMLGSVMIGYILDFSFKSRRMRGFVGIGVVGLLGTAIWGGGLANQLNYTREHKPKLLDFKSSGDDYAGPFVLYFSYGLLDAMFQSMVYWVIGALADDSVTLSRYSGFYKGWQSAGAAVAWAIDKPKNTLLMELILNWSFTTVAYPLLILLVFLAVKDEGDKVDVEAGYSSLAIALVLPESGCLVACERDAKCLEVAKRYYERAGVSHKVDVRHALAADTLKSLILNGEACSYDFAFVDAEKRMYHEYFELLLQLVRVGGVIVIDNVLWHGKVADSLVNDPKTISIRNFNKSIFEDPRISISMVPIGDGMTICRKK